ncbi:MFS transporter [Halobaculum sp. MBLA0143]|uniref:MFS transporter n=1 Tax=Halobaculum sp. MBLA0143 TaxID=3079933 RepID=UPI0035233504
MGVERPPSVVSKYYLYQATRTFGFFWPVFTLFLLARDLSYTQIALLNSLSAGVVVVGELPTGYVADRIGRRNSMVVSSVLYAASILGFAVAESFPEFVVLWTVWAFAQTFRSGAGAAWLYETLEDRLDESAYTHVRGRGGSVNRWVGAGTMLAAGPLYGVDHRLPFLAAGLLNAGGVAVLLTMPKTSVFDGDRPSEETFSLVDAVPLFREQLSRPPLRSVLVYAAVFFGVVRAADEFVQPVAVDAGVPVSAIGTLYAGFTAVSAVASYFAGDVEDALTTRWAVVGITGITAALLVVPAFLPVVALPAFFAMKSANTLVRPIVSGYLNDHAESVGRASLLSAASLVYALVRIVLQPVGGVVADRRSPLWGFAALGGLFLVVAVAVFVVEAPAAERAGADEGV